jgi:hypothetical protein
VLQAHPTMLDSSGGNTSPALRPSTSSSPSGSAEITDHAFKVGAINAFSSVLVDLYSRWARRPFSSSSLWEVEAANTRAAYHDLRQHTPFASVLLRKMPWAINFHERVKYFREILDDERQQVQGSTDMFAQRAPPVAIRVRRARILEDGMERLARVNMKERIAVRYVNEFGEEEAGIDAGGLFKVQRSQRLACDETFFRTVPARLNC